MVLVARHICPLIVIQLDRVPPGICNLNVNLWIGETSPVGVVVKVNADIITVPTIGASVKDTKCVDCLG